MTSRLFHRSVPPCHSSLNMNILQVRCLANICQDYSRSNEVDSVHSNRCEWCRFSETVRSYRRVQRVDLSSLAPKGFYFLKSAEF